MTTPAPGWYPDPHGQPQTRWWDGSTWTAHTQPDPPAPVVMAPAPSQPMWGTPPPPVVYPVTQPARYSPGNPYNPDGDRTAGKNTAATAGLTLGIVCLFGNVLLLPGIAAIVWSSIALSRASKWAATGGLPVGRTKAAWGLALGIIGTLGSIALKGGLF